LELLVFFISFRLLNGNRKAVAVFLCAAPLTSLPTGFLVHGIFPDQVRERLRPHLFHNPGAMNFNRPVADPQPFCQVPVRYTGNYMLHDFPFTSRQTGNAISYISNPVLVFFAAIGM
jgi:hypothetical protein